MWSGLVAQVAAQESAAPVFAIIDVQKIMRESTAVKSLSKKIESQRAEYQAGLRKKEEDIRNADQELTRQRSVLSADAYAKKLKELEDRVATIQREIKERKKKLDQHFAAGMVRVQNELAKIAKEIVEERGLDMILFRRTAFVVKAEFDITNEALKRLNTNLPNVAPVESQN